MVEGDLDVRFVDGRGQNRSLRTFCIDELFPKSNHDSLAKMATEAIHKLAYDVKFAVFSVPEPSTYKNLL